MLRTICLGILGMLLVQPADAGIMEYFGVDSTPSGMVPPGGMAAMARSNFLGGLTGGVGTEDFENETFGDTGPLNISFPGSTGNITATLGGSDIRVQGGSAGSFPTSGTQQLDLSTSTTGGEFIIDFDSPISAFGFYATDTGDSGGGDIQLTLSNGATETLTVPVGAGSAGGFGSGNLIFYGFIDDMNSYDRIEFNNTAGSGDVWGFDDMTIGDPGQVIPPNVVPEPGSLTVFGAVGIIGLAGSFRRRKTNKV